MLITVVSTVLLMVLAAIGVYRSLESSGEFSPTKCAENGGRWDEAIEVCRSD